MKFALAFILLILSTSVSGTTYYVSQTGSNSNNGSSSAPWATLSYACAHATKSGDIIHINAGTITETAQSNLAAGVSIVGEGVTSIIRSHYDSGSADDKNNALIRIYSSVQSVDGNNSISYIKFDGDNLTGRRAIYVQYKNKVSVHHCTFVDFIYSAIILEGENSWTSPPPVYSSGNKIYDNNITNCNTVDGNGSIRISGQTDCEIYNNSIAQLTRGSGLCGQNLISGSNNKGTTIYNNVFYTPNDGAGKWNFVFELWDNNGGVEIRNNTFHGAGGINIGGHYTLKGAYDFSVSIHDNQMLLSNQMPYNVNEVIAIILESWNTITDVRIYNNHIDNFGTGVQITLGVNENGTVDNIFIHNNIFEHIGYSDTEGGSSGVAIVYQLPVTHYNNINICNNVISGSTKYSYKGIKYSVSGANTNISILNNIIKGFNYQAISFTNIDGTLNGLQITNNILNGNASNGVSFLSGITPSNYTNTSNYTTDPLFVSSSDFHLQAGSPAIGKGIKIAGITTDFAGTTLNDPPSIGAYEYVTPVPTTPPVTPTPPVYQSSVIENISPSLLEMTYNLNLANIVPAQSAFSVKINSVASTVNLVTISGNKVQLSLSKAVKFGDIITVAYTKPVTNPLQTAAGGMAVSISAQNVTNNCVEPAKSNDPPVISVVSSPDIFSGFVGEIDASGTYDLNGDILTYSWTVSNSVEVSSSNISTIKFLAPAVTSSKTVVFTLTVSDGKASVSKSISVNINPYKPELETADIATAQANGDIVSNYAKNVTDKNTSTNWTASGDNQWLTLKLADPVKISYLTLTFMPGKKYSYNFDIYASKDDLVWDPILTQTSSCDFSGGMQAFDFPDLNTNAEYSYIKYVGHGNSVNSLNSISEIGIYGIKVVSPAPEKPTKITTNIYPNPAQSFFYISIEEPSINPELIRILDSAGRVVLEDICSQGINKVDLPDNLNSGLYFVELRSGSIIFDNKKLVISR
jgi:hypothetical protein